MLGPHAPRRIFDVTLDLQLLEPLFRRELSIERYALAFDCRKVSRGQEFHERELQLPPLFRGGRYRGNCLGKARFAQEHRPTLCDVEFEELHFERKAAQRRGIEVSKQVGRHDHDTVEALHFLQQFIDPSHLPTSARMFATLQKAISLIEEQGPVFRCCFFERGGDILLIIPHPFAHQVRGRFGNQGDGELLAQVLGELGLARAWRPVQKHRTMRPLFQALQDVFWCKAPGGVQVVEGILGHRGFVLFGQIARQCFLAAPDRLHDRRIVIRLREVSREARGLHGGFELRARHTVEFQNLGGMNTLA
jgi:hypothetical protein